MDLLRLLMEGLRFLGVQFRDLVNSDNHTIRSSSYVGGPRYVT